MTSARRPRLRAADIDAVMVAMRAGATILRGGSRAHSTLGVDEQGWYWEHFDEGAVERVPADERAFRSLVHDDPSLLLPLLRRPHWEAFQRALMSDDIPAARKALRGWLRWGDPMRHGSTWLALLNWPRRQPDPTVIDALRERIRDYTLWHLFMEAHAWTRGPEIRESALRFLDQVLSMVGGEVDGTERLRRAFAGL